VLSEIDPIFSEVKNVISQEFKLWLQMPMWNSWFLTYYAVIVYCCWFLTENGLEHTSFHRFIPVLGPDDRGVLCMTSYIIVVFYWLYTVPVCFTQCIRRFMSTVHYLD